MIIYICILYTPYGYYFDIDLYIVIYKRKWLYHNGTNILGVPSTLWQTKKKFANLK